MNIIEIKKTSIIRTYTFPFFIQIELIIIPKRFNEFRYTHKKTNTDISKEGV